jgi:hypothetical protein
MGQSVTHFCALGVGDCSSNVVSKSEIDQQYKTVKNILEKTIQKTLINHTSTISNIANFNVVAGGNIIVEDLNLKQMAKIKSDTHVAIHSEITSNKTINNILDTIGKNLLKAHSKSSFGGQRSFTYTKAQTKLLSEMKTKYKKVIKNFVKVNCISNALNKSNINLKSKTGNVKIKSINIDQSAKVISKNCVFNSFRKMIENTKISDKVQADVTNDTEASAESAFDFNFLIYIIIIIFLFLIFIIYLNRSNNKSRRKSKKKT